MIPKKFCLMGHTIAVRVVPEKDWADDDAVGIWNSQTLTIQIRAGLHPQRMQQVFCHEAIHAILEHLSHPQMRDEVFVDQFAGLMHQMWTTCK